ncbi:hypothetical protein T484DRAFT_1910727 [Baffinella frigidus]|nr:hypothetical protein T484DRAFT_1910727 [Cryptophyta sp. CCMP2293]
MRTICSSVAFVLALGAIWQLPGAGTSPSLHGAWASTRLCRNFGEATLECGESDTSPVLRLRGGKGPKAKLKADKHDIRVHLPSNKLVKPHHQCLKSALHRARIETWHGRRIFVRTSFNEDKEVVDRYRWDGLIRIGDMQYGTGKQSVMRVAGDDQIQLWGQWHFAGESVGVVEGAYIMHEEYSPYKPLMIVEDGAVVSITQCEVRNFGGKCIIARFFSQVTLEWCTVGGSAGPRSPDHHKKLQVWKPNMKEMAVANAMESLALRKKPIPNDFARTFNFTTAWAPGGTKRASDGVSVESGAMLIAKKRASDGVSVESGAMLLAKKVVFEDTGRAHGMAVRAVGHGRVHLIECR